MPNKTTPPKRKRKEPPPKKTAKRKQKRKKGDPGTRADLIKRKRQNQIKELLRTTMSPELISTQLKPPVSRWTVQRDLAEIETETLEIIQKIPKEEVFLGFMADMEEDQRQLLKTIMDARTAIKQLKPNQRSRLFTSITDAIRARMKNRTDAAKLGQRLGIYPMVAPQMEIHITHEMRVEVTHQVVHDIVFPVVVQYVTDPEDQRNVSKEIDRRILRFLSESGSGSPGPVDPGPQRGRPRNRQ